MWKIKFSWRIFEIALGLVILLIHLYIAFAPPASMLNWYSNDDAFYYFKVAQNIATGHGVTFDGINVTNGFHPLWMLVCIPVLLFVQFDLTMPLRILIVITGLLSAGTALLLFHFLKRIMSPVTAACAAVLGASTWLIHSSIVQNSLESNISAFYIILLLFLVVTEREKKPSSSQPVAIGLAAGLTVLARLDNIYLVMLVGVWMILDVFPLYLRTVIVSDFGIIFCAGLLSYFIRIGVGSLYIANSASLPWLVVLNFIITPLSLLLFGLNKPSGEAFSLKYLERIFLALSLSSIVSGGILIVLQKLSVYAAFPRLVIIINWALLLAGVLLSRALTRWTIVEKAHSSGDEATIWMLIKSNWKQIFRRAFSYFTPLAVLLGAYMAWSQLTVGTPMPVSGQVKQWWGSLPNPVYGKPVQSGPALLGFSERGGWALLVSAMKNLQGIIKVGNEPASWWVIVIYAVVGTGLGFLVIKNREWIPGVVNRLALPAWFWGIYAHIFYYTNTSYVHMRPWYWSAEMLFSMVMLAILFEFLWKVSLRPERNQWPGIAILVLIGLSSLALFMRTIWQRFPYASAGEDHEYITDARQLESLTEPGSLIGMTGSGADGYFVAGRTIVNLDGLVNSLEYFHLLQTG